MIVAADNPDVAAAIASIADVIRANDGYVSEKFIARESAGHFSCAVTEGTPAGEILVEYPGELSTPMHLVEWTDDHSVLTPRKVPDSLTSAQRELLDHWLIMVNATEKLRLVRESLPQFVIGSWTLRHHLADAGHPAMRDRPGLAELRDVAVNWHCRTTRNGGANVEDPAGQRVAGLIPLKHLVNHHPAGATQSPVPGKVAVVSSEVTGTNETFECYGDLDSLQLLMGFGFRSDFAPLVHSVPVAVQSERVPLQVSWLAPRGGRARERRDVPILKAEGTGLMLHDLTFRPDNRPRVRALLAMALRSRGAVDQPQAEREAEAILDAIAQENLDYYRKLDQYVVSQWQQEERSPRSTLGHPGYESPDLPRLTPDVVARMLEDIAYVSMTQQHKLQSWWG